MKKTIYALSLLAGFTLSTKAQLNFAAAVDYGAGSEPFSVTSADFNNDGKLDLVAANRFGDDVSILLGSGTGTFAPAVNYGVGAGSPRSVTTADFNGDGKLDLATANWDGNTISILLGSGTGTFAAAVNYGAGNSPSSVTSGDFNGDGKLDLAVANAVANNVSILLGSGTGTFAAAVNYGAGNNPRSVTSGDFNGDGKLDLATANWSGNNVSILLGSGTGTFAAAVNYGAGNNPSSVTSADFNGDGKLDLATANGNTNNVSILLGSGTGTFAAAVNYGAGSGPVSVTSADFNGDGNLDLAAANEPGNNVSILLGSGTGTFAAAVNYGVGNGPRSVTSGDFNGDGKLDLAIANWSGSNVSILLNTSIFPAGAALNFSSSGNADFIGLPPAIITNSLVGKTKLTVEAWVRPTSLAGFGVIIGNFNTPNNEMLFLLRRDNNNYSFGVGNGTIGALSGIGTAVGTATLNVWQHVVGVFDGSVISVYINGAFSASVTAASNYTFTQTNNNILLGTNNISQSFDGDIDEVRIWDRALCLGEIQNNMTGEIATTANGLIANYHFNQGISSSPNATVTALTDFSGNSFNGALSTFSLSGATSNWVFPGAVTSGSNVVVFVSPTVAITGSNSICNGSSVILTANGNVASYAWLSGPNTATNSVSPTSNTTYSFVGTNSLGCVSNMAMRTVTVNAIPTVSVTSGAICNGSTFTMVPSGASSYTYSSGSAIVSPMSLTSYSVTGTSAAGCVSSNTAVSSVTVNARPTVSVTSGVICNGSTFTMVPSGASSFTFSNGSNTVSPTANTSYSVTVTNTLTGCTNTAVSTVTVNALPTVLAFSSNTIICTTQSVTLNATGATTYTWSNNSTGTTIVVNPSVTATYSVTGANANGCVNVASVTQNVSMCTGLELMPETLEGGIFVYPNPSTGLFNIDVTTTTTLSVFNILGAIILNSTLEVGTHQLDLNNQPAGIYFAKVISNGKIKTVRLIKE